MAGRDSYKNSGYSDPYVTEADRLGTRRRDPYGTAQLPSQLQYYKADARTGKRETLPMTILESQYDILPYGGQKKPDNNPNLNPIKLLADQLYGLQQAQKYGGPKITPEEMAALLFQEGRPDFGLNSSDMYAHDKQASELRAKLSKEEGYPVGLGGTTPADLAASILYAQKKGAELGVPWTKVWNGLGRNVAFGRSTDSAMFGGKVERGLREVDYVKEHNQNRDIVNDPKNAEILNFIRQQMAPPPSLDTLNQQEYQRRTEAREAEVAKKAAEYSYNYDMGGRETAGDRIKKGLLALFEFKNPFPSRETLGARFRREAEDTVPKVRPYTPKKKNVKVASKASGGAIIIDDGNPAKRRKLI
jgi:hypothetical protein